MMKKLFSFFVLLAVACICLSTAPIEDCRCNGIPLYGRVKIVDYHADFDVKVVEYNADLDVKLVDYHPNSCGLWQIVTHNEDFTVRMVDYNEDFSIRYVDYHPGEP